MTFNGLTDAQAENSRKKHGNCCTAHIGSPDSFGDKMKERFGRIPVKIYIIIYLLYIIYCIILMVDGVGGKMLLSALPAAVITFITASVSSLAEIYTERAGRAKLSSAPKILYKAYRCGNTVREIPAEEIAVGDYILLTAGDIAPAECMVLHGDITAEKDGSTRLIRNFKEEEITEDISGSYTVERDSVISSGYAVVKILRGEKDENTDVQTDEEDYPDDGRSALYGAGIAVGVILAAVLTAFSIFTSLGSDPYGTGLRTAAGPAVYYALLLFFAADSLKDPGKFFLEARKGSYVSKGVRAEDLSGGADYIFADKSAFVTDGKPVVTGFTDGNGESYSAFYEVPYPLGTIAARAAAENTSALINRGRIICADPFEKAETEFMSERISNTVGLEITPELINGEYSHPQCKRLLKGSCESVLTGCKSYFDASGNVKPFTSSAAISAMAKELVFQGSVVYAYAAENYDGSRIFIGMLTLSEKQRSSAPAAYKALSKETSGVIILSESSPSDYVAPADGAVTGASRDEIISFVELRKMEMSAAQKALKKIKIITGKADKEYLIDLCRSMKKTVGVAVLNWDDMDAAKDADVLYASSVGCMAAAREADAVIDDGLASIELYSEACRSIRGDAAGYGISRIVTLVLSAFAMSPMAVNVFGNLSFGLAAALNIAAGIAACVIFGRKDRKH
jgi:hypothetical protein